MAHEEQDEKELEELTKKLRENLEIKDRKYLLTQYPKCFVGNEAVEYMVKSNISSTRQEAVHLGKLLMAANVIRHVTGDHDFKDENKFYMFTSDEPSHGQKAKKEESNQDWSWSDFIPGGNSSNPTNLQAKIEDLNEVICPSLSKIKQ